MPAEAIAAPAAASVAGDAGSSSPSIATSPSAVEEPLSGAPPEGGADAAQPEAGTEPGAEAEPQVEAQGTAEEKQDARLLPKHIRELKTTNPEAFKVEKQRFYEHRSYKETFPTVAEARAAKQTLDVVGGKSGLDSLQEDVSDFREVASQFLNGDPKFASDLFEQDPIAAAAHVPTFLNKYAEIDREGYNREIAKRFSGEFQAVNLRPSLEAAYQAIAANKPDEAKEILQQIAGWHDSIQKVAKSEEDPRYQKLKQQLKEANERSTREATSSFVKEFMGEAIKGINADASQELDAWMKGRNLDPEIRKDFLKELIEKADGLVTSDEDFARQREQVKARGDKQAAVRFARARYQEALKDAVKSMMRKYGSVSAPAQVKAPPANGNGAPPKPAAGGFVSVNTRPTSSEIDRVKTPFRMMSIEKRAILKDGRKVSWAHLA